MARDSILPGTHRDVWIFPELYTIAIHNTDAPIQIEDTFYPSNTFICDYIAASMKELEKASISLMGNKWVMKKGEPISYNEGVSNTYRTAYAPSHKWNLIGEAWSSFLLKNPGFLPRWSLLSDFYTRFIREFPMNVDGKIYTILHKMINHPEIRPVRISARSMSTQDYLNSVSPIGHFPPGLDVLKNKVFYDPRSSNAAMAEYSRVYTQSTINSIRGAMARANRIIYYSDIIKPIRGPLTGGHADYGFYVDWSPFGLTSRWDVPWDFIHEYTSYGKSELKREAWWDSRNNRYEVNNTNPFYTTPQDALIAYYGRDSWIQYWMQGGMIPLNPGSVNMVRLFHDRVAEVRPCSLLDGMYGKALKRNLPSYSISDFFSPIMEFGMMVSSIAVAISTPGGAAKIFSGQFMNVIKNVVGQLDIDGDIKRMLDISMPLMIVPLLNSMRNMHAEKKWDEATKFMMTLAAGTISSQTGMRESDIRSDIRDTVKIIDVGLSEREKEIIGAVTKAKAKTFSVLVKRSVVKPVGVRDGIVRINPKILQSAIDKGKLDKNLLIGAGIAGAALLYSFFKKGK